MFSKISPAKLQEEEESQIDINSYIASSDSFVFQSGAGAGKTYALVESLKYIVNKYGNTLFRHNQKIMCITYTNVAANELRERLGASQLVKVSTIHERIWDLIKDYKPQLVEIHKVKLNEEISLLEQKLNRDDNFRAYRELNKEKKEQFQKIMLDNKDNFYKVYFAKAREVDELFGPILSDIPNILKNKDKFRRTVSAIYKMSDYEGCLNMIENKEKGFHQVIYNSKYNRDRLQKMQISHDTLLEYGLTLIQKYDLVKQIIIDQYPYVLIDEYQDTSKNVIEIMSTLNKYASEINRKFLIGYFGDAVQSIYENGTGKNLGEIHSNLYSVIKTFNRRSCKEVINVTNKIRMDSIIQESIYDDSTGGSVKFYYGVRNNVNAFINKYLEEWNCDGENPLDCFFLTHRTAATYSGFGDIYEQLSKTEKYKVLYNQLTTELLSNDITKLGEIPRFLYNIIHFIEKFKSRNTPIIQIYDDLQFYEEMTFVELQEVIKLLGQINGTTLGDYIISISELYNENENIKLRKIIDNTLGIESITYESIYNYLLNSLFPDIKEDKYKNAEEAISNLLDIDISSYENWYQYIQKDNPSVKEKINYHTYHSTKGLEFNNVLIIMENNFGTQKDLFNFYFKHYDNEGLENDELIKFEKARNLLYVACSRAIKNLRILYLDDIAEIKDNITEIFGEPLEFSEITKNVHS
ncbi:ATP-dependent helicase [Virgibacillus sp. YIM 98842]|uniref:ATP-dependent helicase n=1 Tax=Virgibacillus sp. YIM 98842 TaxID=2663533 RepID=UPI0013DD0924|nr:ATP-dependent helicase [Virgibacillus sp. YIM 98842]